MGIKIYLSSDFSQGFSSFFSSMVVSMVSHPHQEGIRMVSQLCKGGACGDAFGARVGVVLERSLQRSQNDGKVLCHDGSIF